MLNIVEKVETNDFNGALDELEVRKDELVETHEYLTELAPTTPPVKYTKKQIADAQAALDKVKAFLAKQTTELAKSKKAIADA